VQLPGPLVDSSWLHGHLDDVVLLDVRWYLDGRSGREAFDQGHIPGARFVDLDRDLSGPATREGGRHPLPSPEDFASSMGRLGVANDSVVVVYDDTGGVTAGRGWWMLDAVGVAVALLDGGMDAWTDALETTEARWDPSRFDPMPWPVGQLVGIDEVEAMGSNDGALILDARSAARYRGEKNPIDEREGHIPGARSAPFSDNLGPDGRFMSPAELAERYQVMGADARDVIVYCGSGVSACHNLLAMRAAGLGDGRLFVGSWSAWAADHERPLETGG
jgi:thiosulfate/3-mercaptopyruvate sulfurtransferase